ncbi:MAG: Do family serine endopeptidase [Spirochaetales bacterium]|nr:Do family serine endopeptidase [Spirochaetales bacterium]
MKKDFFSRHLLWINLILFGILAGFSLALVSFSCTTDSLQKVRAQEASSASPVAMNLEDMQSSFRAISAAVLPVVVEITTTEIRTQRVPDLNGFPFDFFFPDRRGNQNAPQGQEREFRAEGLGSGVIVQRDNNTFYVLTNNHVVEKANEIKVILYDKTEFPAELVGRDERKDAAVIKFQSSRADIPVGTLGDSDSLFVGDWVLAVGSPFGYISTVTAGIVSALGRRGPGQNINDFIQTDAAINQGNSGGALVNLRGEIVGINTWIATPNGNNAGLGFAIPINNLKKTLSDFIATGEVHYGWIGVAISDIDAEAARALRIEGISGALVQNIYANSPAARGGLLPGDWVHKINNRVIHDQMDLSRTVGDFNPGDRINLEVYRNGETRNLQLTVAARQTDETIAANYLDLWPGMSLFPLSDANRQRFNVPASVTKGVMVAIYDKSKAQVAGLRDMDIVTAINGREVANLMDFYRELNAAGGRTVTFHLIREGNVELEIGIVR